MKRHMSFRLAITLLMCMAFMLSSVSTAATKTLTFQSLPPQPPPNDNFANATVISALPFDDTLDPTGALWEAGEPSPSCASSYNPSGTIWYAFTPQATSSIMAYVSGPYDTLLAAYAGDSLPNLTEKGCRAFGGRLTFLANAGTTYYFQVARLYYLGDQLSFRVEVTPPPQANFGFEPSDPSVFDMVQFYDYSYDPAEVGIQTRTWDLGDGTTSTDGNPAHKYARDGDYTVKLTVTTSDGRSASTSQVVHVETHDVAITKLTAPQSASAGQTRQITVGINSKRYVEQVRVELYKSVVGGYQWVGALVQQVPVRPANRTTTFAFSYTFTQDDATLGKVTFKAVASIMDARDVLPADNEAISSPTKVNK